MNVYAQAKKLKTLRNSVKELALEQENEKKQLSEKTSKHPSYLQHKIDMRRNHINRLHFDISRIKDSLKILPRGFSSYESNLKELNEFLNLVKKDYIELAETQYKLKKSLKSMDNYESKIDYKLAQSQKMKNKKLLNELSLDKKELKLKYKYLSDRLYESNVQFAKQRA